MERRLRRRGLVTFTLVLAAFFGMVLAAILIPIIWFLSASSGIEKEELARVTSPDGTTDAVAWSVNAGGATGYINDYLYLTPTGEPAEEGTLVLSPVDSPDSGFKLRWRDDRALEAGPRDAKDPKVLRTYSVRDSSGRSYSVEWLAGSSSPVPRDAESTP